MITPELLEYVRTEIAKGRTREEIHRALISSGGWNEDDLSEAFRIIIPMQNIVLPKEKLIEPAVSPLSSPISLSSVSFSSSSPHSILPPSSYSPSLSLLKSTPPSAPTSSSHSSFWQNLIFIILGLLCVVSWYFYRPQITSYWNSYVNFSEELSANSWNKLEDSWNSYTNIFKKASFPDFNFKFPALTLPSFNFKLPTFKLPSFGATTPAPKVVPAPISPSVVIKDCGTTTAPKLDVPSTYENNSVFSCLGASAVNCENAKGVLKDDFFPTVFEITKSNTAQGSCNFKLSYPRDSTLSDITGKKLAGQSITCPVSIVKMIDNTKPTAPKFTTPDKKDMSKYGSQIYFYGTLGLFVENNLDQNKIQALPCSGSYIDSVIASYQKTQN